MWTCPSCGKRFKTTNQWHSCARRDLESFFLTKPPIIRSTFDQLMEVVERIGPVTLNPVKTSIQVKIVSTYLGVKPKNDHLLVEFFLGREVKLPQIKKYFRISKNRIVQIMELESPADITKEVKKLLKESYDLVR